MPTTRNRTQAKPASQRRKRRAPVPQRGWQHHKTTLTKTGRKYNRTRKSIGNRVRRINKRRGAVYGVLALGVAAVAFSLAFTGAVSEVAAWELGLAGEGLHFGVAWIVGDLRKPEAQSTLKNTAQAMKTRAAVCGAPTVDGSACKNRGRCPHHQGKSSGGRGGGQPKTAKPQTRRPASKSAPKP
jgi:hypothetical protein